MGPGRMFIVTAVYENGVLKLRAPLPLEEHTEVRLLAIRPIARDPNDPEGWRPIGEFVGAGQGSPTDASEKHDDDAGHDPLE